MTKPHTILKIEGPPGSGKSRELAREACRLIVQDGLPFEQILFLAATPRNQRRLRRYLRLEAEQAGLGETPIAVMTWENFLLDCLNRYQPAEANEIQMLSDADSRVLIQELLRQIWAEDGLEPPAGRYEALSRMLLEIIHRLQRKQISPSQIWERTNQPADGSQLPLMAKVYERLTQASRAAGLFSHAELMNRLSELMAQKPDIAQDIEASFSAFFVDEAQELSQLQHEFLAQLPVQRVLAGNEKLGIRSYRGAAPERFKTLADYNEQPVTLLPKQACMRGNEPVLSLLNTFLPQPLWEEQMPDRKRLKTMVHFGFYPDPQQEAKRMADGIARWVAGTSINGRPASWDDCIILLRSGRYKAHAIAALLQKGIPFRSEALSDIGLNIQHRLYDLLCVFEALLKLGVKTEQTASEEHPIQADAWFRAIRQQFSDSTLPLVQKEARLQTIHRHLQRWLEAKLADQDSTGFTLDESLDATVLPPFVQDTVSDFAELYGAYVNSGNLLTLSKMIQAHLLPQDNRPDEAAPDETEASEATTLLAAFHEQLERLNICYQRMFSKPLSITELLGSYARIWDAIELSAASQTPKPKGGQVRLLNIHQVQGDEAPFVWIPFLVDSEFPLAKPPSELLSEVESETLGLTGVNQTDQAEEARLLASAMTRARQRVVLSCHETQDGDLEIPVNPSRFYQTLLDGKRRLLGLQTPPAICQGGTTCDLDDCGYCARIDETSEIAALALEEQERLERYMGTSLWADTQTEPAEALYAPDAHLTLSASSMKTFMTCPRQFYYKHLLRLPQPGSDAATMGTLIHRLMEVFNRQAGQYPYTAERLNALAECLFLFEKDPDAFFSAGFTERDQRTMQGFSPLALVNLQQRLQESILDLRRKGYFERYANLKTVEAEKSLESITIDGIERCRFSGQMDAVIQTADDAWEILDYKTFRSAYGATRPETCDQHFRSTLDPLPDEEDLSHGERFADKLNASYPKDYQLPLYYLACRQNPQYENRLKAIALQVIRPAFPDNPNQGAIRLEITGEEIEAAQAHMTADINRHIVQPILNSTAFETNPGSGCAFCAYAAICEAGADADGADVEGSV